MTVLKNTFRFALAATMLCSPLASFALSSDSASATASAEVASLPESPGASLSSSNDYASYAGFVEPAAPQDSGAVRTNMAPKWNRIIEPSQTVQPFTAGDKFKLSVHENLTISNLFSSAFASGYSHLTDSRPHYGEDMPAFGERFGASMLKGAIQNISRDGIFANVFHEDPHYYIRGRSVPIKHRALYAASRTFVVRKDNGKHGAYYSNFAGIVVANAMSNFYYPTRDVGQKETFQSIGMAFVTNVATNELKEFLGDAIHLVLHKKN